jgi:hypothetical protein
LSTNQRFSPETKPGPVLAEALDDVPPSQKPGFQGRNRVESPDNNPDEGFDEDLIKCERSVLIEHTPRW